MNWFDSLSLRTKLIFNFVISSGLLIAAIVISYVQIERMDRLADEMSNHTLPSLTQTAGMSEARMRYRIRSLEFMLAGTAAERDKTEQSLVDIDDKLSRAIEEYRKLATDPQARGLLDNFAKAEVGYRDTVMKAVALVKSGQEHEAMQLQRTEWFAAGTQVASATTALLKHANDQADAQRQAIAQAASHAKRMAIGALVLGTLVAGLVSILLARRITARLQHAVAVANGIAAGRLGKTAGDHAAASTDEIGTLMGAIDAMRESLRVTIGETRDASSQLSASAEELSKGVKRTRSQRQRPELGSIEHCRERRGSHGIDQRSGEPHQRSQRRSARLRHQGARRP
ncbi:MAG: methyl-accepting chemotaxis protein [Thauera sp.]